MTNSLPRLTLIIGGARSGKSSHAEKLVLSATTTPIYIATAQALDDEMDNRIKVHRAQRGGSWTTVEEPMKLVAALNQSDAPETVILVDCLTLWLSNLMVAERDVDREIDVLISHLGQCSGTVVLVSNEVGLGIVPENSLARAFRDHAGILNQKVAEVANRVVLMTAGLPLTLKDEPL